MSEKGCVVYGDMMVKVGLLHLDEEEGGQVARPIGERKEEGGQKLVLDAWGQGRVAQGTAGQ